MTREQWQVVAHANRPLGPVHVSDVAASLHRFTGPSMKRNGTPLRQSSVPSARDFNRRRVLGPMFASIVHARSRNVRAAKANNSRTVSDETSLQPRAVPYTQSGRTVFSRIKHFRGVSTRYDKLADNYLVFTSLACVLGPLVKM
jgi:transposase